METKVYNCMNPKKNPLPPWMRLSKTSAGPDEKAADPVEAFKRDPDSFFPDLKEWMGKDEDDED